MLDIGMLMYIGLFIFVCWREIFWHERCASCTRTGGYVPFFLLMLLLVFLYTTYHFYQMIWTPVDPAFADFWRVPWLKMFVITAPISTCFALALCIMHVRTHLLEIRHRKAMRKHDRVLQVVTLPAVFGLMALASMIPSLQLITGSVTTDMLQSVWWNSFMHRFRTETEAAGSAATLHALSTQEVADYALWKYNACFYVADLFEAWVLFQFGKLVLEQVGESIALADDGCACRRKGELIKSHKAVATLSWVGMTMFMMLCVMQAFFSVFPYFGGTAAGQRNIMTHLGMAGFLSSSVALYNLYVVEDSFHEQLQPIGPIMKFLSVKILVTLSWIQESALQFSQVLYVLAPDLLQRIAYSLPCFGDVLTLTPEQVHLFYPAMVTHECFFLAVMHIFVWSANEAWYSNNAHIADFSDLEAKAAAGLDVTPVVKAKATEATPLMTATALDDAKAARRAAKGDQGDDCVLSHLSLPLWLKLW